MKKVIFLTDLISTFGQIADVANKQDMSDLSTVVEHAKSVALNHLKSSVDGLFEPNEDDKPEI